MNAPNLTSHAAQRLAERCSLAPATVQHMIADGASSVVSLVKAGKYSKHLFYSIPDDEWFIAVQETNYWNLLTIMPLAFLKNRIDVTAAQKRSVRKKAVKWEKSRLANEAATKEQATVVSPKDKHPSTVEKSPDFDSLGWKIHVRYQQNGKVKTKNLGKSLEEHGAPSAWLTPGRIHSWLRERLIEGEIPFDAIHCISISRKDITLTGDWLLEYLPLTPAEIAKCK